MRKIARHRFELRPATAALTCALAFLTLPARAPVMAAVLANPVAQHVTVESAVPGRVVETVPARRINVVAPVGAPDFGPTIMASSAGHPPLFIATLLLVHHLVNARLVGPVPAAWIHEPALAAFAIAPLAAAAAPLPEPGHLCVAQAYALAHCLLAPPV